MDVARRRGLLYPENVSSAKPKLAWVIDSVVLAVHYRHGNVTLLARKSERNWSFMNGRITRPQCPR